MTKKDSKKRVQPYDHKVIEEKWAEKWEKDKLFHNSSISKNKKRYLLFALAYPSGQGLHVGHVETKTGLDIMARFYRMKGGNVFFPVGWDSFGLPAENYAVKTGVPPEKTTKDAIRNFVKQTKRLGISYQWDTETSTCDPSYYKWTQWMFLQLYHKGLAYKAPGMVNWCPSCKTALANEQVVSGDCERCGSEVAQKEMEQWYFRITKYLEELISGLDQVDWPAPTVAQQLNWIGKKKGINISYPIKDTEKEVTVFTTRPDTNYGATFIVVSPEYAKKNLLTLIHKDKLKEVEKYIEKSFKKTELERIEDAGKKTGTFTGLYAVNRLNDTELPIYVADFVLSTVGTGAVVGVPGHDLRDFQFAKAFGLPVLRVVKKHKPPTCLSYLMGADSITDKDLKGIGVKVAGRTKTGSRKLEIPTRSLANYKKLVREKLSKGFWNEVIGEDIWFLFKMKNGDVKEYVLDDKNTKEIGKLCSELNNDPIEKTSNIISYLASNDWYQNYLIFEGDGRVINSKKINGLDTQEAIKKISKHIEDKGWGKRVTTYRMRDWLISRQRYWGAPIPIVYDPQGKPHPVKEEHLPWLLPTDVDYNPKGTSPLGSSEELKERTEKLYGADWTPEIDTMDTFVDSSWYFMRYVDPHNNSEFAGKKKLQAMLPVDFYMIGPEHTVLHLLYARFFTKFLRDEGYLDFDEPFMKLRHQGIIMGSDGKRMSKSRGNIVNPDDYVKKFGADTLRLYEMFMGPFEANKAWNHDGVSGVHRLLMKIWRLSCKPAKKSDPALVKQLHSLIKKVEEDIPGLKFNTSIAKMMEFTNAWTESKTGLAKKELQIFIQILAPFAPFMAEELWSKLGEGGSVHESKWPKFDSSKTISDTTTVPIQVNGKLRATLRIKNKESRIKEDVVKIAKQHPNVAKYITGEIKKEIFIPGKLINFVV